MLPSAPRLPAALAALALLTLAPPSLEAQVINLEIDYMVKSGTNAHSHEPSALMIDALVRMFACHGITLNAVVDDAIPHINVMQTDDHEDGFFTGAGPDSFLSISNAYFDDLGDDWYYCVIGHQYTEDGKAFSSSGLALDSANVFVVTLGYGTNEFQIAATLAHELGHTLGLSHKPILASHTKARSPVYASLMSYEFQLQGVGHRLEELGLVGPDHHFKDLDYSNGWLPSVYESALDESVGVGVVPLDWDCDGSLDAGPVDVDLDEDTGLCGAPPGDGDVLSDQDDWALVLAELSGSDAAARQHKRFVPPEPCQPFDPDPAAQYATATLAVEPCVNAVMWWVDASAAAGGSGSGDDPIKGLDTALTDSTANSVLFLQAGTYKHGGTPLVIDEPRVLTGPGGAVIDP